MTSESSRTPGLARTVAALELGFCSRFVLFDVLDDCLAALINDIGPNPYAGMQLILGRMLQSFFEHEKAANPASSFRAAAEWSPSFFDEDAFAKVADRALVADNPLRRWYVLGTILGECYRAMRAKRLGQEDVQRLVTYVQELPSFYLDEVQVLRALTELAHDTSSPNELLEKAITSCNLSNLPPLVQERDRSTVSDFLVAIVADLKDADYLGELPLTRDARDGWIYRRVMKLVPLKQIRDDLKRIPEWDRIESVQGIRSAAIGYATRKKLPLPPNRPGGPRRRED